MFDDEHSGAMGAPAIVAIGGSAGGLIAVREMLAGLPEELPAAVVVVLHLAARSHHASLLPQLLRLSAKLPVQWAEQGGEVLAGNVYVAPQDTHTSVMASGHFRLFRAAARWQPSIDVLFESVAEAAGRLAIGVVLSGWLDDGARGARAVQQAGGVVLVQDPVSSFSADMPRAALAAGARAFVLPPRALAAAVTSFVLQPAARHWFGVGEDSAYLRTRFA